MIHDRHARAAVVVAAPTSCVSFVNAIPLGMPQIVICGEKWDEMWLLFDKFTSTF